jgi:hypothetical protein
MASSSSKPLKLLKRSLTPDATVSQRGQIYLLLQLGHTKTRFTQATFTECEFVLIEHPEWAPDLAPSDFHLFPAFKHHTC